MKVVADWIISNLSCIQSDLKLFIKAAESAPTQYEAVKLGRILKELKKILEPLSKFSVRQVIKKPNPQDRLLALRNVIGHAFLEILYTIEDAVESVSKKTVTPPSVILIGKTSKELQRHLQNNPPPIFSKNETIAPSR